MKTVLNILFNIVIPVVVGYAVFGVLLSLFTKIPEIGLMVSNVWYLPFTILTVYMIYDVLRDFRITHSH